MGIGLATLGVEAPSRSVGLYARGMRVEVDGERCQGHNRCYVLAPELFDVDDYGNAVVRGDGRVDGVEIEAKARLAVANCPEYAISLVEEDRS